MKEKFNARYNNNSVIVYQAFNDPIADFAVANQVLGGNFSLSRTSWIKTSFLWMMYRSEWATRDNQTRVLEINLDRDFFNSLLKEAVPSAYQEEFGNEDHWRERFSCSDIILQLDPDRDIYMARQDNKAIHLGLRRKRLRQYSLEKILRIKDITPFVRKQQNFLKADKKSLLELPEEKEYPF